MVDKFESILKEVDRGQMEVLCQHCLEELRRGRFDVQAEFRMEDLLIMGLDHYL
jgi:hypothetical protein